MGTLSSLSALVLKKSVNLSTKSADLEKNYKNLTQTDLVMSMLEYRIGVMPQSTDMFLVQSNLWSKKVK
jgi:hypothetical protein